MGKEMRTLDRKLLEEASENLTHSGGTRTGQSCHFEADVWSELRTLVKVTLGGESYYLSE